jgi:hypothetical protein
MKFNARIYFTADLVSVPSGPEPKRGVRQEREGVEQERREAGGVRPWGL